MSRQNGEDTVVSNTGHRSDVINKRTMAWLVWSCWGLVVIWIVVSFVLQTWVISRASLSAVEGATWLSELLNWVVFFPAAALAYATVGVLVAARRPPNPIGWLCLLMGLLIVLQDAASLYVTYAGEVVSGGLPAENLIAWLASALSALMFPLPITLLLLLFPSGRLLSRHWVIVVALAIGSALLVAIQFGVWTTQGHQFVPGRVIRYALLITHAVLVAAMIAVGIRWRRVTGIERQQLKWLLFVGTLSLFATAVGFIMNRLQPALSYTGVLLDALGVAGLAVGIPITIGLAILRYRLWEIDILIRRTLIYSALSVTLALVYFGCVLLLLALLGPVVGRLSTAGYLPFTQAAPAIATLTIAALFAPLRRYIQDLIDRSLYRRKYNAEQVLVAFSVIARSETDLGRLTAELVELVKETMQPTQVALWLRPIDSNGRYTKM